MEIATGLIAEERLEMGWDDEDHRYMNHLDDVYNGRIVEIFSLGGTGLPYRERKQG